MAFAQALCSLSRAGNGHSVRLDNFAYKLQIIICALSIACTVKEKHKNFTKNVFMRELYPKMVF